MDGNGDKSCYVLSITSYTIAVIHAPPYIVINFIILLLAPAAFDRSGQRCRYRLLGLTMLLLAYLVPC